MKKYEFTGETMEVNGSTLNRIVAVRDFADVKAGDKGGWIEREDNLSHYGNAWVYNEAKVSGEARVIGNAKVSGNAEVCGDALVYGNDWVIGHAEVSGDAKIYGGFMYVKS